MCNYPRRSAQDTSSYVEQGGEVDTKDCVRYLSSAASLSFIAPSRVGLWPKVISLPCIRILALYEIVPPECILFWTPLIPSLLLVCTDLFKEFWNGVTSLRLDFRLSNIKIFDKD